MLTGGEKEAQKNYEYEVFPFQTWQISSEKKREKRLGENLVRRLEWWTHRIMINSAFITEIYTILYSKRKGKATQWVAFLEGKIKGF